MMPRVLIRTDLGGAHGLGHVTRCRALAHALHARGVEVLFLADSGAMQAFVAPFTCAPLGTVMMHPQDIVVVDIKGDLGQPAWYECMREQLGGRLVLIDRPDMTVGDAYSLPIDLLILPNAHQAPDTIARLQQDFGDRLLYGWDYVMLEEEVTRQPSLPYAEREEGPMVFCAGGSDPGDALRVMYEWSQVCLPLLAVAKVYAYGEASHRVGTGTTLQWEFRSTLAPFQRRYLRHAALVVSLFGQTCYEALWWQTPLLCLTATARDAEAAWHLAQQSHGAMYYGGCLDATSFYATTPGAFGATIEHAWDIGRFRMHEVSAGLFDGLGVQRVADAIMHLL